MQVPLNIDNRSNEYKTLFDAIVHPHREDMTAENSWLGESGQVMCAKYDEENGCMHLITKHGLYDYAASGDDIVDIRVCLYDRAGVLYYVYDANECKPSGITPDGEFDDVKFIVGSISDRDVYSDESID